MKRFTQEKLSRLGAGFASALIATVVLFAAPAIGETPSAPDQDAVLTEAIALAEEGELDAAHALFAQLAGAGNAEAMYHLGAIHHSGARGSENLPAAVYWYEKAAEAGVPEAQLALGSLYFKGKGVPKDLAKALELFAAAAEAGLLAAQYNLAMMHAAGLAHSKEYGAEEDKPRAYKWFTVVLARLDAEDSGERAVVEESLTFLKEEMTAEEIAEGKAMAKAWLSAHPVAGAAGEGTE